MEGRGKVGEGWLAGLVPVVYRGESTGAQRRGQVSAPDLCWPQDGGLQSTTCTPEKLRNIRH